jgi:phosphoglycerol transferase MdoB-like AlkP superfamily enzyme
VSFKGEIKKLANNSEIIYLLFTSIILIGFVILVKSNLMLSRLYQMPIQAIIAVLTLVVLIFGYLIYVGTIIATTHKYRLTKIIVKNLIFITYSMSALRSWRALRCLILFTAEGAKDAKISSKHSVFNYNWSSQQWAIFYGIPLLSIIALTFVRYKYKDDPINSSLITLFVMIIILPLCLGFLMENKIKNKMVMLKTSADAESREMELYQTTATDYRFKDSDGNEFIIPIGEVQEIEYINKYKKI